MIKITINKKSSTPAYRQIIEQISTGVISGKILPGEKLPTERDLAAKLGIARGTITKAFMELANDNLVIMAQGKGTFINDKKPLSLEPSAAIDRKTRASVIIDKAMEEISGLGFNARETERMFSMKIMQAGKEQEPLLIAALDCNPEALSVFEKQLALLPNTQILKILIESLPAGKSGEMRLAPYDLILSTTTHYNELKNAYPEIAYKLMPVSVAPSRETVARLARLNSNVRTGAICKSRRFFGIICNYLRDANIILDTIMPLYISELEKLPAFLSLLDAVIIPPGFSLMQQASGMADIQRFTERGGVIIPFEYQIEKGSLIHIDEKIKMIMEAQRT